MSCKKSKLLLALDEVLDADELDVIAAKVEDDMEADENEDDENDEEEMVEGRSEDSDNEEDPNTSTTIHEADSSPPTIMIPAKRKQKNRSNSLVSGKSYGSACDIDLILPWTETPEPPKKIPYILSITSNTEAKKSASKCVSHGRRLELLSSEPWDCMQAQLLVQMDSTLNPRSIKYSDYIISFTIACVVSQPLPLDSQSDYTFLVEQATKGKNVSTVKVACEQKAEIIVACRFTCPVSFYIWCCT